MCLMDLYMGFTVPGIHVFSARIYARVNARIDAILLAFFPRI